MKTKAKSKAKPPVRAKAKTVACLVADDKVVKSPNPLDVCRTAARVAAQFGRESEWEMIDRVADDALKIAEAAIAMRDHGPGKSSAREALVGIGERYGAKLVERHDPLGMTVGYKFSGGRCTSGFSNIFYLA